MNEKPILSVCIPTYNRCLYLEKTLKYIVNDKDFQSTNDIELIISDNCSRDRTQVICEKYVKQFPDKIRYFRQKENIHDKNFIFCLKEARGDFVKLCNDNYVFSKGSLSRMLNVINGNKNCSIIYFTNDKDKDKVVLCKSGDDFFKEISFLSTWIGGFCVNNKFLKTLDNLDRYSDLKLAQVDILGRLLGISEETLVVHKYLFEYMPIYKKGGYNIAEVFGQNYLYILRELVAKNIISKNTYAIEKKKILKGHINIYYFDLEKKWNFSQNGYFKYLFKDYAKEPYFWFEYLKLCLKKYFKYIYKKEKDFYYKKYTILSFIKIKKKKNLAKEWRKRNRHNDTHLVQYNVMDKIVVGNYTYGNINATFDGFGSEKLYIGNFCSIGSDVKFVSSDHNYKTVSTYPFLVKGVGTYNQEAMSKGDIVVKDDVWIATNSIIMSGVTINQGAVVGAGSVVTKDVPPYSIVCGNPAKVIKYRFAPEIIAKLLKIDYSKLDDEKMRNNIHLLYDEVNEKNVDKIVEVINV